MNAKLIYILKTSLLVKIVVFPDHISIHVTLSRTSVQTFHQTKVLLPRRKSSMTQIFPKCC